MGRLVRRGLIALGLAALVVQLLPYGRNHVNPARQVEPVWNSQETHALAVRACYDCHSNETVWPWYSSIAPVSWFIQRDVDEGRRKLNFSEWDRPQKEARESSKEVRKGKMPPWFYATLQPQARLTAAEAEALIRGLEATLGSKRERPPRTRVPGQERPAHSAGGETGLR